MYRADDPMFTTWESSSSDGSSADRMSVITVYSGGRVGAGYGPPQPHGPAPAEVIEPTLAAIDAVVPGVGAAFNGRAWLDSWVDDPWARGSYAAYLPGQYTRFTGSIGLAEGPSDFAGEHTSEFSQGSWTEERRAEAERPSRSSRSVGNRSRLCSETTQTAARYEPSYHGSVVGLVAGRGSAIIGAPEADDTSHTPQDQDAPEDDAVSGLGEQERRALLKWVGENLTEVRQIVSGEYVLQLKFLWVAVVIGLLAHIGGYALRKSVTTEPLGLLADLLYALGYALWTGVVLVVFLQILPEAKRRQYKKALEAYEREQLDEARGEADQLPLTAFDHRPRASSHVDDWATTGTATALGTLALAIATFVSVR